MRTSTTQAGADTRARLVAAAEELYAARGLEAVSLREISRVAGQRNVTAIQFHFKDREGLIAAIVAKHAPDVEARRGALLDQYEMAGVHDTRALVAALVLPLAARLDDPDGGPAFLRVMAQLLGAPEPPVSRLLALTDDVPRSTSSRWRHLVAAHMPAEAVRLSRRFTAIRVTYAELARRAQAVTLCEGDHAAGTRLFVNDLVDQLTGMLTAPVSAQTLRVRDAGLAERGEHGEQWPEELFRPPW